MYHVPMTSNDWMTVVALLVLLAVLLWMVPSCGDETCRAAHTRHNVAQRVAEIERRHAAFHGPTSPDPLCDLCSARKRDLDGR
jgi:hypothetical protein